MGETLFLTVLQMSMAGGAAVVAVMFARLLLGRAPKIFSYLLWGVVLFRLLCPVTFSARLSVAGLPGMLARYQGYLPEMFTEYAGELPEKSENRDGQDGKGEMEDPAAGTQEQILPARGIKRQQVQTSAAQMLFWGTRIWMAGVLGMICYSVVSLFCFRRRLVGAVRVRDRLYQTDYSSSPFVIGIFRPRIYLPSSLSDTEMDYMILHEQIHIRRKDHLFKMLAFAALCVHWFHPLVWLAFVLADRDMEMSCDEAVIRQLGQGIRPDYAASLLRLSSGRRIPAGTLAAFGSGAAGSRIRHIMHYKKPAAAVVAAAAAVCAITMILAAGSPRQAGGKDEGLAQNVKAGMDSGPQNTKGDPQHSAAGIQRSDANSSEKEETLWMDRFGLDRDFVHQMQCAYLLSIQDGTLKADPAEYIGMQDTQRIRELGLSPEDDLMDGCYFHNPDTDPVFWKLGPDTEYIFLDWGEDFIQSDHPEERFVRTTDREMFLQYIATYDPAPGMPFFFQVENGVIRRIVEMPFA